MSAWALIVDQLRAIQAHVERLRASRPLTRTEGAFLGILSHALQFAKAAWKEEKE